MTLDKCYVCGLVKPTKENAFHCWCFHPNDKEAKYRGICDMCYTEKGDEVFSYIPEHHNVSKVHKYGPEMDEYEKKYKLPKGQGWSITFDGKNTVYTGLTNGKQYVKPPPPKCICCPH